MSILKTFPLQFEVHRHGQSRPRDLTEFFGAASWIHTIRGSTGAAFTLRYPIRKWAGTRPVDPGDWVVLRNRRTGVAEWWGRVRVVRTGVTVGISGPPHETTTRPVELTCESFIGMLTRARVILAPGMRVQVPGGIFQFQSWGPAMTEWMQAMATRKPGELLQAVFKAMALQPLPESLGGEAIGEAVPVAWTKEKAPAALRGRHVDVEGFSLKAFGNVIPRGTVWTMIDGTFRADDRLVEFFPCLFPGTPETALEKALGCQCRIMYRMAPLHPTRPVTGPGSSATGLFQDVPVNEMVFLKSEDLLEADMSWDDVDRVNATYTQTAIQPSSQMAAYGPLGTPVVQVEDATLHGVRMHEVDYPFFPAIAEEGARKAGMINAIDALTEYAMHVLQERHLLAVGTLKVRPDRSLRAGVWLAIDMPDSNGTWYCYVEEVVHSIQVDAEKGMITEHTQVTYSMGSFQSTRPVTPQRSTAQGVAGSVSPLEALA